MSRMTRDPWSLFCRPSVIAVAAAIVAATPALAQNTTSSINGRVTGSDGKPVAGATVAITHVESGSTNTSVTDAEGRYSARGLRAGGPFTVVVTKGGQTDRQEGIVLKLAETLTLDATLGAASQTIVVTGAGVGDRFNASRMGTGTTLGSRELNAYASINRNLQDYARTDPRLSQTDKERGEISAAGQNTRYNSITIDGVGINDTFGLEANGLPTAKQPISIDAIQSVQVNISNYDVTQKGYTGANINAVTKSGTNEFRGSIYHVFRDQGYVGERYNRAADTYFKVAPFKETTTGFTLGGPIIKDTLFFFANYEELKSNRAQPEFGPIGSQLTNVAISQSSIDAMSAIARNQYRFEPGNVFGSGQLLVKDALLKLDWNISDNHRANVRYSKTEQGETNNGSFSGFSTTGLQMTSAWWNQAKTIETVVGQWFADWTPTFSTELKISNRDYNSIPENNTRLPSMALQFSGPAPAGAPAGVNTGNRFLNFGTEQSRHFNILDTQTVDAYAGGTWTLGDHELKFGADVSDNTVFNAFFQNVYGNYTFGCVNTAAATATVAAYTYNFNNGAALNCGTATAAQIEQAVLENFSRGRPSSYQVQLPVPGGTLDDGIARWKLRNTGLFLQDTWTLSKGFTVTAGVRLDTMSINDKPKLNTAAAASTVAGTFNNTTGAVVRNSGGFGLDNSVTVDGRDLVQPRIGFNWDLDPKAARKMQLRGGVGLFQGAAANVWLSNPYSNTGLATRVIGCGGAFAPCPPGGGVFSANPDTQPVNFTGASPAANVDFIESGLGQPSVWKANLAFDVELSGGLVFGAEALFTKNDVGLYYRHLNLGGATRTGPDGRELFYTPQAYNPACWTATGGIVTAGAACASAPGGAAGARNRALSNPAFNNVLLAAKSDKGGGTAVTLSLAQPSRDGLGWNLAYTRTKATEVSPLTSSVANSNFNSRSIFNPNEDVAADSAYLVRDRVSAGMTFSRAFVGKYRTTVGLFYEGRAGKPYSWTYRNDLNGDGVAGNDLMYVPSAPGSGEVVFAGATAADRQLAEDRFWNVVNNDKGLSNSRGGVAKRNGSTSPFVSTLDMRLSQEVPGFVSGHKGVLSIDFLNVGNMINKTWGRTDEALFQSAGGNRRTLVSYGGLNPDGKYVYIVGNAADDLTIRQLKGESQWAVQVTLKYEF
jgi:hypothetical protein